MKKIITILVILFLTIGLGGWVYYAGQFEKYVKEHVKLMEDDKILAEIKEGQMKIKKYFFCAKIKDAVLTLGLNKNVEAKINAIKVTYNPIFKNIKFYLGDDISIGNTNIRGSDIVIKSDINTLSKKRFDIKVLSKRLQIYYDESDDAVLSAKDIDILFGIKDSEIDKDNVKLYLKSHTQDIDILQNTDTLKRDARTMFKNFARNEKFDERLEETYVSLAIYSKDIQEYLGLPTLDCDLQVDCHKDILVYFKNKNENKNDSKDSNMSLKLDVKSHDMFSKGKMSALFSKIGDDMILKYNMESSMNLDEVTKTKIHNRTADFLFDVIKNDSEEKGNKSNVTRDDLMNLAAVITNINKFHGACDVLFNEKENMMKANVEFAVNDHKFTFDGHGNSGDFSVQSSLSNPKSLINSLASVYEEAATPIIKKLYASDPASIKMSEMLLSNIKNNGYEALLAFHKEDTFKDGEDLVTDWTFDNKLHLRINGASFWKVATDERIVKFMQNMPDASSYAKSKEEIIQDDIPDTKDDKDSVELDYK